MGMPGVHENHPDEVGRIEISRRRGYECRRASVLLEPSVGSLQHWLEAYVDVIAQRNERNQ